MWRRLGRIAAMLVLLVVAVGCIPGLGADGKEKKDKDKGPPLFHFPPPVKLTTEQKDAVAKLRVEYEPRIEAIEKQAEQVRTPAQIEARRQARAKAYAEGRWGKEANEIVEKAVPFTPEQIKRLGEVESRKGQLDREVRAKLFALLDDEQKALLMEHDGKKKGPPPGAGPKGKGPDGK